MAKPKAQDDAKASPAGSPKTKPAAETEEVAEKPKPSGPFDFNKSYSRRRPDEPKSHYNTRLKFIHALLKAEGNVITDEKVEVLSHCFSNVKYLDNKYPVDIMGIIAKYDPDGEIQDPAAEPAAKKRKTAKDDEDKEAASSEGDKDDKEEEEKKEEDKKENGSPKNAAAKSAAAMLAAAAEDSDSD